MHPKRVENPEDIKKVFVVIIVDLVLDERNNIKNERCISDLFVIASNFLLYRNESYIED